MIVTRFIAARLLFSHHEISHLRRSLYVALFGLSLAFALLIFVLALTEGFSQKTLQQILKYEPHLMLFPKNKTQVITPQTLSRIKFRTIAFAESYFVEKIVIQKLNTPGNISEPLVGGLYLSAGPAKRKQLSPALLKGNFNGLVIGKALADENNLNIDDQIKIYFPFQKKEFITRVSGIAQFGTLEQDRYYTYHPNSILPYRAIEVRLKNIGELPLSKKYLVNIFGDSFYIRDIFEINNNLFSIVKLVKLILFILLGLTAIIALLQLHSQIQLLIYEKHQSLSILKSLGFHPAQWIFLFFWIATYLSIICLGFGLVLGLLFAQFLNPFILVLEKIFNIYLISNQIGALSYIGVAYPISKIGGLIVLFYFMILGTVFLTLKSVFEHSGEGFRQ